MIGLLRRIANRAKHKAKAERDAALAAVADAKRRKDTRELHHATERARIATERALRMGV